MRDGPYAGHIVEQLVDIARLCYSWPREHEFLEPLVLLRFPTDAELSQNPSLRRVVEKRDPIQHLYVLVGFDELNDPIYKYIPPDKIDEYRFESRLVEAGKILR